MTSMRSQWVSSLITLLISAFAFYGFNNAMTSIMPEYFLHLGGSELIAGIQNSCFILLAIILRFGFGPLADKYGPKRVLFFGALGFTVPTILLPFCSNLVLAVFLRALQAIGFAAFMPNIAFYVRESLPQAKIPFGIGLTRFASALSLMIMPVLLFAIRDTWGNNAMFVAFIAVGVAGTLLTLVLPKTGIGSAGTSETTAETALETAPKTAPVNTSEASPTATPQAAASESARRQFIAQIKALFVGIKTYKVLMILPFVLGISYGVLVAFGPLFTTNNFPDINGGLILTVTSIGGLIGTLVASSVARVFTQRKAMSAGILVNALGLILMACTSAWLVPFFIGSFIAGLGYFTATTLFVATIGTLKTASGAGSLLATQQSCLDLGIMTGNLCVGVLLNLQASLSLVFIIVALLLLVGFVSFLVSKSNNG